MSRRDLIAFDTLYAAESPKLLSPLAQQHQKLHLGVSASALSATVASGHSNALELARARARALGVSSNNASSTQPRISPPRGTTAASAAPATTSGPSSAAAALPTVPLQHARRPPGSAAWSAATISGVHGYAIESGNNVFSVLPSRREALALWISFKSLCALSQSPLGVDRASFASCVQALMFEDDAFVQRAFEVLDASGSNAVAWTDFSQAIQKLDSGSMEDRADFLVDLYDKEGTSKGFTRDNLHYFFRASLFVQNEAPHTPESSSKPPPPTKTTTTTTTTVTSAEHDDTEKNNNHTNTEAPAADARSLRERVGSSDSNVALAALVRAFSDETFDAIVEGAAAAAGGQVSSSSSQTTKSLASTPTVTKQMLRAYVKSRGRDHTVDVAALLGRCIVTGEASSINHIVLNNNSKH